MQCSYCRQAFDVLGSREFEGGKASGAWYEITVMDQNRVVEERLKFCSRFCAFYWLLERKD